ncbi:hypothetical protein FSC37_16510 [Piscinibacter aquaticus]|uniref:Preprotein translocase subunit YajC n=1 Tax=Piscinibacter aquaticus TaxID=392597 RepID=A0A5C6U515_9BURK|nr:hypothetical protein FSC37_16510 [Piscinibacter aquaticus]
MKYLLLVLAVVALVWLVRGKRRGDAPAARPQRDAEVQPMVACRQCGVHLPAHDALPGRGGVFCGEAHRAEYEKQHPAS